MMIGNDWDNVLADVFNSASFDDMMYRVFTEYDRTTCFPPRQQIFASLRDTPFADVRVVILGQDPYHTRGMADGHAFSVQSDKLPPSLVNIFKAVKNDYPNATFKSGSLIGWARQGVLLLNTALSVREGEAYSHADIGWQDFVVEVLRRVSKKGGIVFMLWGRPSADLISRVGKSRDNLYLYAPHPSPLSAFRGFFTAEHFKKCNEYLKSKGEKEIDFSVNEDRHPYTEKDDKPIAR